MDPEQIYQEVLAEEQQKGSAAPVAEGRAKAARQRATQGSPHPKEPKWWPGSQPHLEGGEAAPAEAEEEAVAEEAPAAEAPAEAPAAEAQPDATAAQAPADAGGAAPLPDQAPAAASPPAPAQPAAVNEAPVAVAAAAEAPAPARPPGVTHGTPSGNRLRPEDGVATEAQFRGQQAMYDRRKLIDELVATGVPAVSAEEHGRPKAPALALLYILIPLLAVFILVSREENETEPTGGSETENTQTEGEEGGGEEGGGEAGGPIAVAAANVAFDTSEIALPADGATIDFNNEDTLEHNISIYIEEGGETLFEGEIIPGGSSTTYDVPEQEPGGYYFQCDVHPNMNGSVTVE